MRYIDIIRFFVALALVIALLFQVGSTSFMNIWYKVANESFEEKFCVNTDKPEMSCHGSCMMKKINQAPKEKNNLKPFTLNIQLSLSKFLLKKQIYDVPAQMMQKSHLQFGYIFTYKLYWIEDFFHPPER